MTLIPAFGRDYKSKAEVMKDWNDNRDFIIQDISSRWDGKPANKQDFENDPTSPSEVNIRYKKLTMVMVVKIQKKDIKNQRPRVYG